jgi:hypothetical protein
MTVRNNMSIKEDKVNNKVDFKFSGKIDPTVTKTDFGYTLSILEGDLSASGKTKEEAFMFLYQKLFIYAAESYQIDRLEENFAKKGWSIHKQNTEKIVLLEAPYKIEASLDSKQILEDDLEIVAEIKDIESLRQYFKDSGIVPQEHTFPEVSIESNVYSQDYKNVPQVTN